MMRAVVIISKHNLHLINQLIDQRNVQIVALVADDRMFVSEHCYPKGMVFGLWQLASVVEKTAPDCIINCMPFDIFDFCRDELRKVGYPSDKLFMLLEYLLPMATELQSRLNLLRRNPNHYKIFSTGISYSMHSIDAKSFELPLIGFAFASQDFYYDLRVAEKIIQISPPPPPEINLDLNMHWLV